MFKYSVLSALSCAALALSVLGPAPALAQSVSGRPLSASANRQLVSITQEVLLSGASTLDIRVAPLTSSASGFGTTKMGSKILAANISSPPTIAFPNPIEQGLVLERTKAWMSWMPHFQGEVAAWLTSKGHSTAVYNFTQEVMVQTVIGPVKRAVAFNSTIDNRGRATYGSPKIIDPDPLVLEAVYAQVRPAEGLPTSWTYPNAGQIKWRVLNKKYEPLTGWSLTTVGGVYDEPTGDGDPNAMLACLVDKRNRAGCPNAPDVRNLMDSAGASIGLVSYIRKIQPDYTLDPATGIETAKVAINVTERTYDCTRYANKGEIGYTLALLADQFLVRPKDESTDYQLVQQFAGRALSPTDSYAKDFPANSVPGNNANAYILSFDPTVATTLLSRSDPVAMQPVISVSPLVENRTGGPLAFWGDLPEQTGSAGGASTFRIYPLANHSLLWNGFSNTDAYKTTSYFNIADVSAVKRFTLDNHLIAGDVVKLNGQQIQRGDFCRSDGIGLVQAYCEFLTKPYGTYYAPNLPDGADLRPYLVNGTNVITTTTVVFPNPSLWEYINFTVATGC